MQSISLTDQLIESKLSEITRLRLKAQLASSSMNGEKVKGSGYPANRIEEIIVKITEMEDEVGAEIDALAEKRKDAVLMLDKLEDQRERIILEEKYWNRRSWEDIGDALHFERAQVFRVHRNGLIHLYEKMHKIS